MTEQEEKRPAAITMQRMCAPFVTKEHAMMSAINTDVKGSGRQSGRLNRGRQNCLNAASRWKRRKGDLHTSTLCCFQESLPFVLLTVCSCQNTQWTPLIMAEQEEMKSGASTMRRMFVPSVTKEHAMMREISAFVKENGHQS